MAFYVGQKVVCIEDGELNIISIGWHPGCKPTVGAVYTVAFVGQYRGECALKLAEIKNLGWSEYYRARRFRPVTSIEDLQSIVTEVKNRNPRKIGTDEFDGRKKVRAR